MQSKALTITKEEYERWREEGRHNAGMAGVWGTNFELHIVHYIGWKVKEFFEGKDAS